MAPQVGLEPTTDRLTADSSTTELLRNIISFINKNMVDKIKKLGGVLLLVFKDHYNGAGDENRTHDISLEG